MIINHNLSALNTYNRLQTNNNDTSKSLEKLSSGLRINRAGDDAAGLAISEKMRGQIRGLDQATRNAQDGISLIQTAEGALNESHSILQRMRELAVQSSNDTNTADDRSKIQAEVDQLAKEMTRISNTTEFNTQNLLAGGLSDVFHIGANAGQNLSVSVGAMDASSLKVAGSLSLATNVTGAAASGLNISSVGRSLAATAGTQYTVTAATATASAAGTVTQTIAQKSTNTLTIGSAASYTGTVDTNYQVKVTDVTANGATTSVSGIAYSKDNGLSWTTLAGDFNSGVAIDGMTFTLADATTAATAYTKGDTWGFKVTAAHVDVQLTGWDSTSATTVNIGAKVSLHKGDTSATIGNAQTGETVSLQFSYDAVQTAAAATKTVTFDVTKADSSAAKVANGTVLSQATAVAGIDVSTQKAANEAITTINDAITTVSQERSKLGAYQNRLEHTINNLGTSSENLTASESRVRDVDMAKEMMSFQKSNILNQAATAMLAQANQQPQSVLQLLK